ncbi:hypothetical protein N0M98_20130 [Paenibacillus doosanensis]|uniref:Uncharacterized protein n=1 Tax=Paenibacillus konkukensis TaxID=2020716 RepID=A0ABY4RK63_9BACL|nr:MULTISPECIES: hypothetical protein [Paenibacillus]MCS7462434.1 hypothetical protein [Paenibacillus doosanensis]UQZ81958.1 hypothetical protein SK3146_01115 [Paenibacillus konkukensis]
MYSRQQELNMPNEQGPEEEREEHFLPPRKTVHPTEREKYLPIFYRTLLWLFILLVVSLLVWGWRYVRSHT